MHIGLYLPIPHKVNIAFIARQAELMGFESLWTGEHPAVPVTLTSKYPYTTSISAIDAMSTMLDPFVALAAAASVTTSLKLGTAIVLVPQRNPLLMAKEVSTLDWLSKGRFIFGIGAGWLKEEMQIMGADINRPWAQTRESVQAMKELWANDQAAFDGQYYSFPPVKSSPKPSQKPHPPILLGGMGDRVLRRIVDWADGWLPIGSTPQEIKEARTTLDAIAIESGRDPKTISISTLHLTGDLVDRNQVQALHQAGADRIVISTAPVVTERAMEDELHRVAQSLLL